MNIYKYFTFQIDLLTSETVQNVIGNNGAIKICCVRVLDLSEN